MSRLLQAHFPPPSAFERLTLLHFTLARERILNKCSRLLQLKGTAAEAASHAGPSAASSVSVADAAASSRLPDLESTGVGASAGGVASTQTTDGEVSVASLGDASGAVIAAGLGGVLNRMPSLGFLHSLQRLQPALESAFDKGISRPEKA